MKNPLDPRATRRDVLKMVGGGAVLIPLAGLVACAKKEGPSPEPAPAATPTPTPEPAASAAVAPPASAAPDAAPASAPAPAAAPAPTSAAAGELPHQDENDPMAKALGYHHDSAQVDNAKYPKHAAGQACKHCVQFKGSATDAWGACNIFAGKQVNANGWCSAFALKA